MPKSDKPTIDWSAPDYLRDFINTQLILTFEEESIVNYLIDKSRGLPVKMPVVKKKIKQVITERQCKICGEVLEISKFYKGFAICKECFSEIRRQKRLKNGNNNRN